MRCCVACALQDLNRSIKGRASLQYQLLIWIACLSIVEAYAVYVIITEFLFSLEQGDVSQRARNCFIFEFLIIETDTAKRKLFHFRLKLGE